ncbi:MAG TPA: hypothetical protein ENN18_07845 [Proteobacteria bacterium]|nr:hypothetical protein [Pseudomonadota bacterium]
MRRKYLMYLATLLILLFSVSLASAAEVLQGKFVSQDKEKKTMTVEEYDLNMTPEHKYGVPTGNLVEVNVATAKIGIPPEPGDIVRIAYKVVGAEKVALKVMNVSKQDLRKK